MTDNITRKRKTTAKKCQYCGNDFIAKSKAAKFCTTNCRQDNYLENKVKKESEVINNEIIDLEELIETLFILLRLPEDTTISELKKIKLKDSTEAEIFALIITLKAKSDIAWEKLKELNK